MGDGRRVRGAPSRIRISATTARTVEGRCGQNRPRIGAAASSATGSAPSRGAGPRRRPRSRDRSVRAGRCRAPSTRPRRSPRSRPEQRRPTWRSYRRPARRPPLAASPELATEPPRRQIRSARVKAVSGPAPATSTTDSTRSGRRQQTSLRHEAAERQTYQVTWCGKDLLDQTDGVQRQVRHR